MRTNGWWKFPLPETACFLCLPNIRIACLFRSWHVSSQLIKQLELCLFLSKLCHGTTLLKETEPWIKTWPLSSRKSQKAFLALLEIPTHAGDIVRSSPSFSSAIGWLTSKLWYEQKFGSLDNDRSEKLTKRIKNKWHSVTGEKKIYFELANLNDLHHQTRQMSQIYL